MIATRHRIPGSATYLVAGAILLQTGACSVASESVRPQPDAAPVVEMEATPPARIKGIVVAESAEPVPATEAPRSDAIVVESVPAPEASIPATSAAPAPADAPVAEQERPRAATPVHTHPAALALLNEAMRQEKGGDLELAAAKLERALRIEPRNALLWHRLANVRLRQGQNQLAANLAAKSNSYAPADSDLFELNQRIIAKAKRR
jgi:tetratricopeptide (TPR) repeat protein